MRKIWRIKVEGGAEAKKFASALGISALTGRVLLARNIKNQKEALSFLNPAIEHLHDPFLLKDMDRAVLRIKRAIKNKEKMLVYGDYDVDGITSVALLLSVLEKLGGRATYHIPNRLVDGYGLGDDIIERCKREGIKLIITVDCGTTDVEEVKKFRKEGIDIIITDHHQPLEGKLPSAYALVNPHREDCGYPFKELSGVGVAYKLACAISHEALNLDEHLDLVSLGSVGDVVSLVGENRVLVKHGLKKLTNTKRLGLRALIKVSGLDRQEEITCMHAGFILGPRINAIGRLGSAKDSLRLLLSCHELEAYHLAQQLADENRARQRLEQQILKEALDRIEREVNFKEDRVIVLDDASWHPGVIGIVASRITERYHRPTIIVSFKGERGKGSGRSIENFHLARALSHCKDTLEEFGGHEYAAGFAIKRHQLPSFKERINALAHNILSPDDLLPKLTIDTRADFSELTKRAVSELNGLAPFGRGNPRPIFASFNLTLKSKPRSLGRNTLKFWASDGNLTYEAVGFGMADEFTSLPERFDMAYHVDYEEWNGRNELQLYIKDIREAKGN